FPTRRSSDLHAGDGVNAASPEGDVEPDVRVGVGLAGRGEQLVGGQGLGEGADGAAALGEAGEQLAHFAFEVVAVVEDDLGALEFDDVGGGGLVEVRIDAGAHERLGRHAVAADLAHEVVDHAGGADDLERRDRKRGV